MTWSQVGTATVGPQTQEVLVGLFPLEEDHDTLWIRVQQLSPSTYWNFAYGILTWRSSFGKELGSVKCWGDTHGNGAAPSDRNGSVYFSPRAYNRRWISVEDPPEWSLNFEAKSGILAPVGSGVGIGSSAGVFTDLADARVTWRIGNDGVARLNLQPTDGD